MPCSQFNCQIYFPFPDMNFLLAFLACCVCTMGWPMKQQEPDHMLMEDQSLLNILKPESHDKPVIQSRGKRITGLFHCNGWGPGCSNLNEIRHPKQQSTSKSQPLSKARVSLERLLTGYDKGPGHYHKTSFEPFFTLTSGKPNLKTFFIFMYYF